MPVRREDPPNEPLPWWLQVQGEDPVLRSVLEEMWQSAPLRERLTQAFAPEGNTPFGLHIGGTDFLDRFNRTRPRNQQVRIDKRAGAVALYNEDEDEGAAYTGGIVVDMDRIHDATRARRGAPVDSARARELVRDAVLHELAHFVPVAEARSLSARTFDPKPGSRNQHKHPVIIKENRLRSLLGLPEKKYYGLLGEVERR
jgi:hypothetical protein